MFDLVFLGEKLLDVASRTDPAPLLNTVILSVELLICLWLFRSETYRNQRLLWVLTGLLLPITLAWNIGIILDLPILVLRTCYKFRQFSLLVVFSFLVPMLPAGQVVRNFQGQVIGHRGEDKCKYLREFLLTGAMQKLMIGLEILFVLTYLSHYYLDRFSKRDVLMVEWTILKFYTVAIIIPHFIICLASFECKDSDTIFILGSMFIIYGCIIYFMSRTSTENHRDFSTGELMGSSFAAVFLIWVLIKFPAAEHIRDHDGIDDTNNDDHYPANGGNGPPDDGKDPADDTEVSEDDEDDGNDDHKINSLQSSTHGDEVPASEVKTDVPPLTAVHELVGVCPPCHYVAKVSKSKR